ILAAARLRARLAMLERAAPGDMPGEQLLEALVLGQRSAVDPALNQAFVETGSVHYLSVSGAHVGMLASAVWLACMLAGISRRSGALVRRTLVTADATLAEPSPPVIRSAIMGVLLCTAILLRRPVRTANWLALSAVVILVVSPVQLFEPGFQLSFLTLIGLIYLGPQVHRGLRDLVQWLRGADDPLLKPPVQRLLRPTPL